MELAPVEMDPEVRDFYRKTLAVLNEARAPFLVGGAYALAVHAGIERHTKDLDIFIYRKDCDSVLAKLREAGYRTEVPFPHWLAKAHGDAGFIDVIYGSGNGVSEVDEGWFDHAAEAELLGIQVKLCPAEEMIWTKAFVQERERFDGADVAHLIRSRAHDLDWERLLQRFGDHWRILYSHLITFGFIYPAERAKIPARILEELADRLRHDSEVPNATGQLCQGTLLSREQYLADIRTRGYRDARLKPVGRLSAEEIAHWTAASVCSKP